MFLVCTLSLSLSHPVSHSIVLSLEGVFSCVFMRWWWFFMIIRTLNLRHLRWGSAAPSIPPIFSGVITFCHSVSPSSYAPISVLSFQSNSSFFLPGIKEEQELATFKHMNESGPAHFFFGCLPKRIGCQSEGMREEKDERSIDERDAL